MPELPEVESLARFLRQRADGHVIDRADSAAISVLKTYRPDLSALHGRIISDTQRHGKFLDLVAVPAPGARTAHGRRQPGNGRQPAGGGQPGDGPLHLVIHLARAGWLRWRDDLPPAPPKPGKGPLGFRLRFTDGAGFDLTEAGTKKRLAVYLVADPSEVPGVAALGPDPMADSFTVEALAGMLAGRRMQIKGVLRDQKIIAGIGNAYSDEVLHAARMSPFKLASSFTDDEVTTLHAGDHHDAPGGRGTIGRAGRRRPQGREEVGAARARPGRGTLPGVRRHGAGGLVRGLRAAVLPDLPDGRQAAG